MDSSSQGKKRDRGANATNSHNGNSDVGHEEPPAKKAKVEETVAGTIKRAAPIPSGSNIVFKSPLRDLQNPSTKALEYSKQILAAVELNDKDQIFSLIENAFQLLTPKSSYKTDPNYYLALIYVSKVASFIFLQDSRLWKLLLSKLMPTNQENVQNDKSFSKRDSEISVLAANLLFQAFKSQASWPVELVQAYLEDAFASRLWVDDETTRPFVCNLLTVCPLDNSTESYLAEDDKVTPSPFGCFLTNNSTHPDVLNRFPDPSVRDRVHNYISDILKYHIATHTANGTLNPSQNAPAADSLKNLIRVMSTLTSYPTARHTAVLHLECWLNNVQTQRWAKELMRRMAINCVEATSTDLEIVRILIRIRPPVSLTQCYYDVMARIVQNQRIYQRTCLVDLLTSEHLAPESPGGPLALKKAVKSFETIYNTLPAEEREAELASVIQELALDANFAPHIQIRIRTLIKSLGPQPTPHLSHHPIDIAKLCICLCKDFPSLQNVSDANMKRFWPLQIADILTSILLSIAPSSLYEQPLMATSLTSVLPSSSSLPQDKLDLFNQFKLIAVRVQSASMAWCHEILPRYRISEDNSLIPHLLRKLLFLEPMNTYYCGNKLLTTEQLHILTHLISSVPIEEESLVHICLAHLSYRSHHIPPIGEDDVIQIIEDVVLRAAKVQTTNFSHSNSKYEENLLSISNNGFYQIFASLASFRAPTDQVQINGALIPFEAAFPIKMVFSSRIWKICLILIILAAFNPSTLGRFLWEKVPTIRSLLEMVITRSWKVWQNDDSAAIEAESNLLQAENLQNTSMESALLAQYPGAFEPGVFAPHLLCFDTQFSRKPPENVLSLLKRYDKDYRLSFMLSKSRDPDFVNILMKSQGQKSVRWLGPLVTADSTALDTLPNRCVSHLLLSIQSLEIFSTASMQSASSSHDSFTQTSSFSSPAAQEIRSIISYLPPPTRIPKMVSILRSELNHSIKSALEIFEFFLSKLYSPDSLTRIMSNRALSVLLSDLSPEKLTSRVFEPLEITEGETTTAKKNFDWIRNLKKLQFYHVGKDLIIDAVCSAIQIETDIDTLSAFISLIYSTWAEEETSGSISVANSLLLLFEISKLILPSPSMKSLNSKSTIIKRMANSKELLDVIFRCFFNVLTCQSAMKMPSSNLETLYWRLPSRSTPVQIPSFVLKSLFMVLSCIKEHQISEVDSISGVLELVLPGVSQTQASDYVFKDPNSLSWPLISWNAGDSNQLKLYEVVQSFVDIDLFLKSSSMLPIIISITAMSSVQLWKALDSFELADSTILLAAHKINNSLKESSDDIWNQMLNQQVDNQFIFDQILVCFGDSNTCKQAIPLLSTKIENYLHTDQNQKNDENWQPVEIAVDNQIEMEQDSTETKSLSTPNNMQNWNMNFYHCSILIASHSLHGNGDESLVTNIAALLSLIENELRKPTSMRTEERLSAICNFNALVIYAIGALSNKERLLDIIKKWESILLSDLDHHRAKQDWNVFPRLQHEFLLLRASTPLSDSNLQSLPGYLGGICNYFEAFGLSKSQYSHFVDSTPSSDLPASEHLTLALLYIIQHSTMTFPVISVSSSIEEADDVRTAEVKQLLSLLINASLHSDHRHLISFTFSKSADDLSKPWKEVVKRLFLKLLIHQTTWQTKTECADFILSRDAMPVSALDHSKALDFLEAYLYSDEGWYGLSCANGLSPVPSLFSFDSASICRLVDIVLQEISELPDSSFKIVSSRTKFLLSCAAQSQQQLTPIMIQYTSQIPLAHGMNRMRWIDDLCESALSSAALSFKPDQFLLNGIMDAEGEYTADLGLVQAGRGCGLEKACEILLEHIYFQCPWQVFSTVKHFTNRIHASSAPSALDNTLHKVIKKIGQPGLVDDAFLSIRKVALSHPTLVMKFLPTLGALIKGKSQNSIPAFLALHHHKLFENIISVLTMLSPLIFQDSTSRNSLNHILDEYFKVLEHFVVREDTGSYHTSQHQLRNLAQQMKLQGGDDEALIPLVSSLFNFLGDYYSETIVYGYAHEYLKPKREIILATYGRFSSIRRLKDVLDVIDSNEFIPIRTVDLPMTREDIQRFKSILSTRNDLIAIMGRNRGDLLEAVQSCLADLDRLVSSNSSHGVLLVYFISDMLPYLSWSVSSLSVLSVITNKPSDSKQLTSPLIAHAIDHIRKLTFKVVLQYLHYYPREADKVITKYMECLSSSNTDVRNEALLHSRQFFAFTSSTLDQINIMMILFKMGKVGHNELRHIIGSTLELN